MVELEALVTLRALTVLEGHMRGGFKCLFGGNSNLAFVGKSALKCLRCHHEPHSLSVSFLIIFMSPIMQSSLVLLPPSVPAVITDPDARGQAYLSCEFCSSWGVEGPGKVSRFGF